VVVRVPSLVVEARSDDDVRAALAVSRSAGVPVAIRGCGHSCNGQTLTEGIQIVAVPPRGAAVRPLGGGVFEIDARARWRQVEAELHAQGRTVPVLADYLDLTVGGTLSVGGYGATSIVHGAQVDHVESLELILPDGSTVRCSREESRELFRLSLAGLGQVGVIARATIRTVPHQPYSALFVYEHGSLSELVEAQGWMTQPRDVWPSLFKAVHARGRFVSTCGVTAPSLGAAWKLQPPAGVGLAPRRRYVLPHYRRLRSATVALWVARFGTARRLWSDYVLDFAGARAFAAFLTELTAADAFAGCLKAVYVVPIRRPAGAESFALEAAGTGEGTRFGIGVYSMVPAGAASALVSVEAALAACLSECVRLGGRPYLYGWHRLSGETLRQLYGAGYERLLQLRRELDPAQLFQTSKILEA